MQNNALLCCKCSWKEIAFETKTQMGGYLNGSRKLCEYEVVQNWSLLVGSCSKDYSREFHKH
jgi:hypothetical protein